MYWRVCTVPIRLLPILTHCDFTTTARPAKGPHDHWSSKLLLNNNNQQQQQQQLYSKICTRRGGAVAVSLANWFSRRVATIACGGVGGCGGTLAKDPYIRTPQESGEVLHVSVQTCTHVSCVRLFVCSCMSPAGWLYL